MYNVPVSRFIAACLMMGLHVAAATAAESTRPNIVLIYTDDHDLLEVGCYGGKVLTPHMDSLARDGIKFTRFYVSSPVCSPSRFGVLSGRYASRSLKFQKQFPAGGPVNMGWEPGVFGEKYTLPAVLRGAGYATGMVGKWHQGTQPLPHQFADDEDPADPTVQARLLENYRVVTESVKQCGFGYAESVYQANVGDGAKTKLAGQGKAKVKRSWLPGKLQLHNMDWVTAGALDFIEQNKAEPFFLYMAPTLVHGPSPLVSLKADPRATPIGYLEKPLTVQPSREDVLARVRAANLPDAAAGETWLDDGVGAVLKRLDGLGLTEKTLVILAGDNGNVAKFTCYDGGGLMPMLARWPGVIRPGTACDKLACNLDIAPTALEIGGVSPPPDYALDGRSILPALRGDPAYRRDSLMLEVTTERAVITDDGFKYIAVRYPPDIAPKVASGQKFNHWCQPMERETHTYGADKNYPAYFDLDQLYNLRADPAEQRNLAKDPSQSERLAALKQTLTDYSRQLPHAFGEFAPGK